ncbi:MAG: YjbF family lipoprotein [Pseudomonadota bacterium]
MQIAIVQFAKIGRGALEKSSEGAAGPADPRAGLTPSFVAKSGLDLLYAEIPVRQGRALLTIAGRNGNSVTWLSADKISLTFERDQLIATRGFGEDLMGANPGPVLSQIGQFTRDLVYLDGESQPFSVRYRCTRSLGARDTTRILGQSLEYIEIIEACKSAASEYTNLYFRSNSGKILQSKQWISPEIGYVVIENLNN